MHSHDHEHDHPHHPHSSSPSGAGSVVLDIGDAVGALVVHTTRALAGVELQLAKRGEQVQFVHTEVRERILPGETLWAAVFMAVPEGKYTLLDAPPGVEQVLMPLTLVSFGCFGSSPSPRYGAIWLAL